MTKAVLDTNVYVDWFNCGRHEEVVVGRGLARFLSTIVQMELRAGTTTLPARRALDQVVRAHRSGNRLLLPAAHVFDDAGAVLGQLRAAGRDVRRAAFVNDVLIALSARTIGATVFTANGEDFEVIRAVRSFELRVLVA